MKLLILTPVLTLLGASLAVAQSHPSWWTYASPDSTALVGIRWESLRQSPFADAVQAELSGAGSLGFPDLDCLRQARELVVSAPPLLAAEAGKFSLAAVQQQATSAGLHRAAYKGVAMYLPSQTSALGLAQMSETLVLVGTRKTLEGAVDRSLMEIGRRFTPLLMRAARYSQTADLWVVSTQLPDALASRFVPLEVDAQGFEGSVSMRGGLNIQANFDAASDDAAAKTVSSLRQQAPSFPAVARGLRAASEANHVAVELSVSPEQLNAELRVPQTVPPAPPAPAPAVVALAKSALVAPTIATLPPTAAVPAIPGPPPAPAAVPVPQAPEPRSAPELAAPAAPQVIRIVGLDDGPRVILFPTAPSH